MATRKGGHGRGSRSRHLAAVKSWVTRRRNAGGKSALGPGVRGGRPPGRGRTLLSKHGLTDTKRGIKASITRIARPKTVGLAKRAQATTRRPKSVSGLTGNAFSGMKNTRRDARGKARTRAARSAVIGAYARPKKMNTSRAKGSLNPKRDAARVKRAELTLAAAAAGLIGGKRTKRPSAKKSTPGGLLKNLPARLQDGTIVKPDGRVLGQGFEALRRSRKKR